MGYDISDIDSYRSPHPRIELQPNDHLPFTDSESALTQRVTACVDGEAGFSAVVGSQLSPTPRTSTAYVPYVLLILGLSVSDFISVTPGSIIQ